MKDAETIRGPCAWALDPMTSTLLRDTQMRWMGRQKQGLEGRDHKSKNDSGHQQLREARDRLSPGALRMSPPTP